MDIQFLLHAESDWWWILPVLVFAARVMDVSLGTLRVLFVSRGLKVLAPLVGFFEVLIWITAVAQVVRNLDNPICFFAYAAGYGLGTYVGLAVEQRLSLGTIIVRAITQKEGDSLVAELRRQNFGVTSIDAQGAKGQVKIIFAVIRRTDLEDFLKTVKTFNPNTFYTIEDVRTISRRAFPHISAIKPSDAE